MDPQPIALDSLIAFVKDLHPAGGPLERLSDAIVTASQMGEQADALIGYFVDQARGSGATWSQIGESMGVSKQAAQKRFVPREEGNDPASASLNRFTARARHALALGRELTAPEGGPLSAAAIVVGAVALGEGIAAAAVTELGLEPAEVCAALGADWSQVQALLSSPAAKPWLRPGTGARPVPNLSPDAKALLGEAIETALRLGHNYIGTEHLLLAALTAQSPLAPQLAAIGLPYEVAEQSVKHLISAHPLAGPPG